MKREDIKTLYTIDIIDGTLTLIKRDDIDSWLRCRGQHTYSPNILINPKIDILPSSGVLNLSGTRLSYSSYWVNDNYYYWSPIRVSQLLDGWEDKIFYSEDNIIEKDVTTRTGLFNLKKSIETGVKYLKEGHYLNTKGYVETQSVSNYRVVGNRSKEIKGRILG